jgi:tetratricopeptide (TPR) repeat protein
VDAVLGSVSPARQRLTHGRVADLLAERTPEAVDHIASLYARGGDAGKAYEWCTRAATRALSLHALDTATEFLQRALANARTDEERYVVLAELARAAELSGRWVEVERWCDAMLAIPGIVENMTRALSVQQRRMHARVRLGQPTREMERECRELVAIAERLESPAEAVRTRSLLVQTLERLGRVEEAIAIAEESLRIADSSGDETVVAEALLRLAHTLLAPRPPEAMELLLRLIAQARNARDPLLEARAYLMLGVARLRTRDDSAGAEAFRVALKLALEAQALDIAAGASMNLGVVEMRSGDFSEAHTAFNEALRLYTTLRNNTSRLVALYNLANLEWERGDSEAAAALYRETSALAEQLGADDIAIGAHAGAGLVALRLHDPSGARNALAAAQRLLGARGGWWFQGRERLESLTIRLATRGGNHELARARFKEAVSRLEAMDVYTVAWMVADCAAELAEHDDYVWDAVSRLADHGAVQQFVPLSARYTALRDLADRRATQRLREGREMSVATVGPAAD